MLILSLYPNQLIIRKGSLVFDSVSFVVVRLLLLLPLLVLLLNPTQMYVAILVWMTCLTGECPFTYVCQSRAQLGSWSRYIMAKEWLSNWGVPCMGSSLSWLICQPSHYFGGSVGCWWHAWVRRTQLTPAFLVKCIVGCWDWQRGLQGFHVLRRWLLVQWWHSWGWQKRASRFQCSERNSPQTVGRYHSYKRSSSWRVSSSLTCQYGDRAPLSWVSVWIVKSMNIEMNMEICEGLLGFSLSQFVLADSPEITLSLRQSCNADYSENALAIHTTRVRCQKQ